MKAIPCARYTAVNGTVCGKNQAEQHHASVGQIASVQLGAAAFPGVRAEATLALAALRAALPRRNLLFLGDPAPGQSHSTGPWWLG